MDSSTPITELQNLGPRSAEWLADINLRTLADLEVVGAVGAFRMVQHKHAKVSLNLLWALYGAIENRDWRDVTDVEKTKLRAELEAY